MYNNQIFALLGHNGAGKTTTISMLTGLLPKTKGSSEIYDVESGTSSDIFNDMQTVRQSMGVCPQHDILFELLTPVEHLEIFYDFKGGKSSLKSSEV